MKKFMQKIYPKPPILSIELSYDGSSKGIVEAGVSEFCSVSFGIVEKQVPGAALSSDSV
jgi:hypothetical protein